LAYFHFVLLTFFSLSLFYKLLHCFRALKSAVPNLRFSRCSMHACRQPTLLASLAAAASERAALHALLCTALAIIIAGSFPLHAHSMD
jgi:hypothetical protein